MFFKQSKKELKVYLMKISVLTVLMVSGGTYFKANYSLGIEAQGDEKCIPGKTLYITSFKDKKIVRDMVYEFKARNMTPFFSDDTKIGKVAMGMPGDHVVVTKQYTSINGKKVSGGLKYLMPKIQKKLPNAKEEDYVREFTIPPNEYLFMGLTDSSYDGRYWGTVKQSQIIGRAYGIL